MMIRTVRWHAVRWQRGHRKFFASTDGEIPLKGTGFHSDADFGYVQATITF